MSPKGFSILAGTTAIAVALAAWSIVAREAQSPATASVDRPVVEGLVARLNEIGSIVVGTGASTITLARGDAGGWSVVERGGYPADAGKVRELALATAGLRQVETKTAARDRLPRLELEDPGAGAKSKRLELRDKAGKPLAALIIGKTSFGLYGGGRSGVYVRRADEPQAWLAAGQLDVPSAPMDVVQREFLNVQPAELARITLGAGGPAPVVLRKPAPDAEAFTLETPSPPGKQADPEKLERLGSSLVSLTMQEVKPAAEIAVPDGAPRARFETWDGLVVEARAVARGEGEKAEHWVMFAPSDQPPLATQPTSSGDTVKPAPATGRAATMKAQLEPWAFQLPDYLAQRLGWGLDDVVAAPQGAS